jgi:hypothetical protein
MGPDELQGLYVAFDQQDLLLLELLLQPHLEVGKEPSCLARIGTYYPVDYDLVPIR